MGGKLKPAQHMFSLDKSWEKKETILLYFNIDKQKIKWNPPDWLNTSRSQSKYVLLLNYIVRYTKQS